MNLKFAVSVVVIFILSLVLGFVVHGILLHDDYARLPQLMRTQEDAMAHFPYMIVGNLAFALGFTWIYLKGREEKPWLAQGLRYGIAVAVMMTLATYLMYFAVMPWPSDLVAQQVAFDTIAVVILAIVLAWMNR